MNIKHLLKTQMNIPNIITLLRLPLILLFMGVFFFYKGANINRILLLILLISSFTDILDGFIARKYNMISDFGKILDPFCDKVTQFGIMICFCLSDKLLLFNLLTFFLIEFSVIYFGILVFIKDKKFVFADNVGKITTVLYYVFILIYLILGFNLFTIINLVVLCSLVRLLNYVSKYLCSEINKNNK